MIFKSLCSYLESYFMPGILQISIFSKTNILRNPMDNLEENIDEIILAHCKENFFCMCKVFRSVRNCGLPPFLSAESQVGNWGKKKSALHTMAFSEYY